MQTSKTQTLKMQSPKTQTLKYWDAFSVSSLNMALSPEFCGVEENHDERLNVGIKRQTLSLPLEYTKTKIQNVPNKSLGSGKEALSKNFQRVTCFTYLEERECIYDPSSPYTNWTVNRILLQSFRMSSYGVQRTKIVTSEVEIFSQELAFRLLGSNPSNILTSKVLLPTGLKWSNQQKVIWVLWNATLFCTRTHKTWEKQ